MKSILESGCINEEKTRMSDGKLSKISSAYVERNHISLSKIETKLTKSLLTKKEIE